MVISKLEQEDTDPPPPYTEDDDYDVYLFYPSVSSRTLFSTCGAPIVSYEILASPAAVGEHEDHVLPAYPTSVGHDERRPLQEPDGVPPCLASSSHSHASASNFALTGNAVMATAGYSELFRAGLSSQPCIIKRQLGYIRKCAREALRFLRPKSSS